VVGEVVDGGKKKKVHYNRKSQLARTTKCGRGYATLPRTAGTQKCFKTIEYIQHYNNRLKKHNETKET